MDAPKQHVLDRLERRWEARLAQEATTWRSERPTHRATHVVDRAGRSVPLSMRRSDGRVESFGQPSRP